MFGCVTSLMFCPADSLTKARKRREFFCPCSEEISTTYSSYVTIRSSFTNQTFQRREWHLPMNPQRRQSTQANNPEVQHYPVNVTIGVTCTHLVIGTSSDFRDLAACHTSITFSQLRSIAAAYQPAIAVTSRKALPVGGCYLRLQI